MCKDAKKPMCKCANVQVCKCESVQMCKCANAQECKDANVQWSTCATMPQFTWACRETILPSLVWIRCVAPRPAWLSVWVTAVVFPKVVRGMTAMAFIICYGPSVQSLQWGAEKLQKPFNLNIFYYIASYVKIRPIAISCVLKHLPTVKLAYCDTCLLWHLPSVTLAHSHTGLLSHLPTLTALHSLKTQQKQSVTERRTDLLTNTVTYRDANVLFIALNT